MSKNITSTNNQRMYNAILEMKKEQKALKRVVQEI